MFAHRTSFFFVLTSVLFVFEVNSYAHTASSCLRSNDNCPGCIPVQPICQYINLNISFDLLCTVYIGSLSWKEMDIAKYLKVDMVIPGDADKLNMTTTGTRTWCSSIRSAHIYTVYQKPVLALERVILETEAWEDFLRPLKLDAYVEFDVNKSLGFVELWKDCDFEDISTEEEACVFRATQEVFTTRYCQSCDISLYMQKAVEHFITELGGVIKNMSYLHGIKQQQLNYFEGTKIEYLNISKNNFIDILAEKTFVGLDSLLYLIMNDCKIVGINQGNFIHTPNLLELDLSKNKLSALPHDLGTLSHLRSLDLSAQHVRVHFALENTLTNLTSLMHLKLSYLNLDPLTRLNLPARAPLSRLHLDFCGLQHLPPDIFVNFTQLTFLTLRGNQLNALHLFFSVHAQRMNMLDAAQNALRDVAYVTLQQVHIDTLDLSSNVIENCSARQALPVRNLNLSYNLIPVINDANVACFDTYDSIDFGANRFSCRECSIREFQRYIRENKPRLLWFSETRAPQCYPNDVSVTNVKYDKERCEHVVNVALISGATLGAFALLALVFAAALYHYRFQVTYITHLLRVRRDNCEENLHCKFDLFVSYCSKDRHWVWNVLRPHLEKAPQNYKLCIDERDFDLGNESLHNWDDGVAQSKHAMCVLSLDYIDNAMCVYQLKDIQRRKFESCKDFLLLVELERLDRAQLPLHLRMLMTSQACLEWHAGAEYFWRKLERVMGPAIATQQTPLKPAIEPADDIDDEAYYDRNSDIFRLQTL